MLGRRIVGLLTEGVDGLQVVLKQVEDVLDLVLSYANPRVLHIKLDQVLAPEGRHHLTQVVVELLRDLSLLYELDAELNETLLGILLSIKQQVQNYSLESILVALHGGWQSGIELAG